MKLGVVIPAAGSGKRFGSTLPKQFQPLNGVPLLVHAIRVFEDSSFNCSVVLAVHPDYKMTVQNMVMRYNLTCVSALVDGGAERSESIDNALCDPSLRSCQLIAVHDAVRPFHTEELLERLVRTAEQFGAAVPCVPLSDTIKVVRNYTVVETVPRTDLRAIQTPQVFNAQLLRSCYESLGELDGSITDDASVLELCGKSVYTVDGLTENIKITTQQDFAFAQFLLHKEDY